MTTQWGYVTEFENKWWFWDENWQLVGPYNTEEEAAIACESYVREVLNSP